MNKNVIKKELEKIAQDLMKGEFGDLYDFSVIEQNGQIILIDHTEESYENRWMIQDFERALSTKGMFLECECPGRYIVCEE